MVYTQISQYKIDVLHWRHFAYSCMQTERSSSCKRLKQYSLWNWLKTLPSSLLRLISKNTTDLSGLRLWKEIAFETAKHCWKADHNFRWDQKKVVDRESKIIPRKIKEIIYSLKNPNHINKIHTFFLNMAS